MKVRYRQSMKAITGKAPDEIQYTKTTRFSLVPFQQNRASLLSNATTETDQRQSNLFGNFSQLSRDSALFQNCHIDYAPLLNFFQGRNSNMSAPMQDYE